MESGCEKNGKKGQKKRIMYASYAFILDTSQKLHGYKTTPREAD
jgi:hypothetical protein